MSGGAILEKENSLPLSCRVFLETAVIGRVMWAAHSITPFRLCVCVYTCDESAEFCTNCQCHFFRRTFACFSSSTGSTIGVCVKSSTCGLHIVCHLSPSSSFWDSSVFLCLFASFCADWLLTKSAFHLRQSFHFVPLFQ